MRSITARALLSHCVATEFIIEDLLLSNCVKMFDRSEQNMIASDGGRSPAHFVVQVVRRNDLEIPDQLR